MNGGAVQKFRNRVAMRLGIAGAGLILSLGAAYGQAPTAADTYIQSGTNAAQNFGALANILVGPGGAAPAQNNGLIRWDLSGFNSVTPSNVQKAVLWV